MGGPWEGARVARRARQALEVASEPRALRRRLGHHGVPRPSGDIASVKEIRDFLVTQQRQMGKDKGIVMDGRDIGTVVFPEAESKFFLTASPEIRAKRRHKEQLEAGNLEPYEAVLENVKARDHQDSTRLINPLRKAESAVEIEVSNLSIDEVYEQMMNQIKGVIGV